MDLSTLKFVLVMGLAVFMYVFLYLTYVGNAKHLLAALLRSFRAERRDRMSGYPVSRTVIKALARCAAEKLFPYK
jgi:hypothetical protein